MSRITNESDGSQREPCKASRKSTARKGVTAGLPSKSASQLDMRTRIKATATDLFIRHGYRGVSFGDISSALGMTRANIHYHFGNKQKLLEEVLEDYVDATLARFRRIWSDDAALFEQKVEATREFNRQRYARFNSGRLSGRPWSLIARMRSNDEVIGAYASKTLKRFARELSAYIEQAVEAAIARGELSPETPVADIVVQAVSITNSAGPITHDAGNFERLESLYSAFLRTTRAAYGTGAARKPAAAKRSPARRRA